MKKVISLFIVIFLSFLVGGCNEKQTICIPEPINIILKENNIYNVNICSLGRYSSYSMREVDGKSMTVSEEEIKQYCNIQLESYSKILPVDNRQIVQEGDVVYVSYLIYKNDKLINRIEHDNLMVGKGYYNIQIEEALVGKKVGVPFWLLVDLQDVGECKLNLTVESINYFVTYELTDEFVKEKFGVNTVEDYYKICEKHIRQQKISEKKKESEKELFSEIAKTCEFELNKEEIAKYSMKYIEEGEKLAKIYDLPLEKYVEEILNKNVTEFYQECYQLAEDEIKEYLVVGAIFQKSNMVITDDEYKSKCSEMEYEIETVEENEQLDALVRYNIMKEKVLEMY